METNTTEETEGLAIEKISKSVLEELLNLYGELASMETYVKIPFALIAVGVLLHNVFLAGKSFDIETYDMIANIEMSIVGIIVFSIFVMAGIAMNKSSSLKEQLRELAKKHNIPTETMENEFNALSVHYYGGSGVKL